MYSWSASIHCFLVPSQLQPPFKTTTHITRSWQQRRGFKKLTWRKLRSSCHLLSSLQMASTCCQSRKCTNLGIPAPRTAVQLISYGTEEQPAETSQPTKLLQIIKCLLFFTSRFGDGLLHSGDWNTAPLWPLGFWNRIVIVLIIH